MEFDYGTDCTTWVGPDQRLPDLDPAFTAVSGIEGVAEAVARRLTTPRGAFIESENDGTDMRLWLNGRWDRRKLYQAKVAVEREAEKDERVDSASARLLFIPQSRTLQVELFLTTIYGPASLVLGIDAVSVKVIKS